MTIAAVLLSLLSATLAVALFFCLRRMSMLVQHVEDLSARVESSLDLLEESHRNIIRSAGQDVISDDIFVRRVVSSIVAAKHAVHQVAAMLASFDPSAVESVDDDLRTGNSNQ